MFDEDILITTSILDNGINLIDDKLTNIVILHLDAIKYVQSIGRKRTKSGDRVTIWLTNFDFGYLNTRRGRVKTLLAEFYEVKKAPEKYCILSYDTGRSAMPYAYVTHTNILVNDLVEKKSKFELAFLDKVISEIKDDPDACIKAQLAFLNADDYYEHLGNNKAEWALYKKLDEYTQYGYTPKSKEILDKIKEFLCKYLGKRNNEHSDRGFSLLQANNRLKEHNIPFEFIEQNGYIAVIKVEISSEEGESE